MDAVLVVWAFGELISSKMMDPVASSVMPGSRPVLFASVLVVIAETAPGVSSVNFFGGPRSGVCVISGARTPSFFLELLNGLRKNFFLLSPSVNAMMMMKMMKTCSKQALKTG
jgi:hypothetical protein